MRIAFFLRAAPLLALFAVFVCPSCKRHTLSVETGYFTRKDLASSHVGTPDPSKQIPIFGQRLYISWNTTPEEFSAGPLELHIQARLKKEGTLTKIVPLNNPSGNFVFPIIGEDFTKRGGLLSYKVTLLSNSKELAQTRHKFWVEELHFSE